ncbi:MAG: VOC family protein [Jatrophihabitantaceae bacterium]
MPARFDHLTISATDFAASLAFYDAALGAIGLRRIVEFGDEEDGGAALEAAGWGADGHAVLWLVAGSEPTHGAHLCLRASSRGEVEAFHRAAVQHGGRSHDAPRRWALYRRGAFHAMVHDPDANLIEAVSPE